MSAVNQNTQRINWWIFRDRLPHFWFVFYEIKCQSKAYRLASTVASAPLLPLLLLLWSLKSCVWLTISMFFIFIDKTLLLIKMDLKSTQSELIYIRSIDSILNYSRIINLCQRFLLRATEQTVEIIVDYYSVGGFNLLLLLWVIYFLNIYNKYSHIFSWFFSFWRSESFINANEFIISETVVTTAFNSGLDLLVFCSGMATGCHR